MKRLLCLAAALLLLLALGGCGGGPDPLDTVKSSGVVRIAVLLDGGRYSSMGEDGTMGGIEVALARAIAADMGAELRLVLVEPDELLDTLETKADLALGRLALNASLRKKYEVSVSYGSGTLYAATIRGVYYPTLDLFSGETAGVSSLVSEHYTLEIKGAGMELNTFRSPANVEAALLDQSVIAYFCYEEQADAFLQNENLQVQAVAELEPEEYVVAARSGNRSLTRQASTTITRLLESGEMQAIYNEWQ